MIKGFLMGIPFLFKEKEVYIELIFDSAILTMLLVFLYDSLETNKRGYNI